MSTAVYSHPKSFDLALLTLRLAVGAIFAAHGMQKITQFGFEGVSGMLASLGVPLPEIFGPMLALGELVGGLALIVGMLTRVAAVGLAIDMLGALLLVHLPNGFFLPEGIEFTLVLLAANLAFLTAGAGRYSIDAVVRGRRQLHVPVGASSAAAGARRVA